MSSHWYVVQVMSGQEKKVKKNLEENRVLRNLVSEVEEALVPIERVAEVKQGEQRITEKRIWPGYVLVKMKLSEETWLYVKETNGVLGFLGGEKPVHLTDAEVEEIIHQTQGEIVHKNKLVPGSRVKIVDGVFANMLGQVVEVYEKTGKLSVRVSVFNRDIPVNDLEFWQVEELAAEDEPQNS